MGRVSQDAARTLEDLADIIGPRTTLGPWSIESITRWFAIGSMWRCGGAGTVEPYADQDRK
jgi:hypothetical protein